MIKTLDIEFYGGPCDGADATAPAGIKRLVIPVGGVVAVYEWLIVARRSVGFLNFEGFSLSNQLQGLDHENAVARQFPCSW